MKKKSKIKSIPTLAERRAAFRAKTEAFLNKEKVKKVPPLDPASIVDTTKIGTKTIIEWNAHVEKLEEKALASSKKQPFSILDLTALPDWVTWALARWKANGRPTAQAKIKEEIETLTEKADGRERFAKLDRAKATEIGMELLRIPLSNKKLRAKTEEARDKKLEAAAKKEAESIALREEAEKLTKTL